MSAQLRVTAGRDIGRLFPLLLGQPLLVGRDYATHTRLKDPQVAMLHCQIEAREGNFVVTDRGSVGGTFVNGARVTEHILQPGDVLRVGDTKLHFEQTA
jgi:pSer/pThr/pTyr-binding forkhead associated (FHA) protein